MSHGFRAGRIRPATRIQGFMMEWYHDDYFQAEDSTHSEFDGREGIRRPWGR
jgi:hypothetical protein